MEYYPAIARNNVLITHNEMNVSQMQGAECKKNQSQKSMGYRIQLI